MRTLGGWLAVAAVAVAIAFIAPILVVRPVAAALPADPFKEMPALVIGCLDIEETINILRASPDIGSFGPVSVSILTSPGGVQRLVIIRKLSGEALVVAFRNGCTNVPAYRIHF